MRDRRSFRKAVTFVERAARHPLELLNHFDGQWSRAAVEGAHFVNAILFRLRMIEQRDVDRGHAGEESRAVIADRGQYDFNVVLRNQYLLHAAPDAFNHADSKAVDVKERNYDQVSVFAALRVWMSPHLRLHDVGKEVVM